MNKTIRKFLNFYIISLKKEIDYSYKYPASIYHEFKIKEDDNKDDKSWFKKTMSFFIKESELIVDIPDDYREDMTVYPMNLTITFTPESEWIAVPKKVDLLSHTNEFIPVNNESEKVKLEKYCYCTKDEHRFIMMSEERINRTTELKDNIIEIESGNIIYPDLTKIYNIINRIIYNVIDIDLDPTLFLRLIEEGEIYGKEIYIGQLRSAMGWDKKCNG